MALLPDFAKKEKMIVMVVSQNLLSDDHVDPESL